MKRKYVLPKSGNITDLCTSIETALTNYLPVNKNGYLFSSNSHERSMSILCGSSSINISVSVEVIHDVVIKVVGMPIIGLSFILVDPMPIPGRWLFSIPGMAYSVKKTSEIVFSAAEKYIANL